MYKMPLYVYALVLFPLLAISECSYNLCSPNQIPAGNEKANSCCYCTGVGEYECVDAADGMCPENGTVMNGTTYKYGTMWGGDDTQWGGLCCTCPGNNQGVYPCVNPCEPD